MRLADRERSAIPCHYLCMSCGLLADQSAGSAYRGAVVNEPPTLCSSCGDTEWADLREEAVVEQLKLRDEALPNATGGLRRALAVGALGLATLAAGGLTLLGAALFLSIVGVHGFTGALWSKNAAGVAYFGSFLGIAGPYFIIGFLIPAINRRLAHRRAGALRWSDRPAAIRDLHAPLTGRACLGYEVAIRKTDDPTASKSTWLLIERRGDIEPEPFRQRVKVDVSDARLAMFLRRRGIDPLGLSLVIYESITAPR